MFPENHYQGVISDLAAELRSHGNTPHALAASLSKEEAMRRSVQIMCRVHSAGQDINLAALHTPV